MYVSHKPLPFPADRACREGGVSMWTLPTESYLKDSGTLNYLPVRQSPRDMSRNPLILHDGRSPESTAQSARSTRRPVGDSGCGQVGDFMALGATRGREDQLKLPPGRQSPHSRSAESTPKTARRLSFHCPGLPIVHRLPARSERITRVISLQRRRDRADGTPCRAGF